MNRIFRLFGSGKKAERSYLKEDAYRYIGMGTLFMILVTLAGIYLSPLLYMGSTALKSEKQLADPDDQIIPMTPRTYHYVAAENETFRFNYRPQRLFEYEGQQLPVYEVPIPGARVDYALLEDRGDAGGVFIDTAAPENGPIELETPVAELDPALDRQQLDVDLYHVPDAEGNDQILGLVQRNDDGTSLWVDPEATAAGVVTLNVNVDELSLVREELDLIRYHVTVDGEERILALVSERRGKATFIDPENPDAEPIELEVAVRGLEKDWELDIHPSNFKDAVDRIDYFRLLFNTSLVALLGAMGAMVSATLVAYGFTRFNIPYASFLFMVLLATIILPAQVTQIPTYIIFRKLGWIGKLYPLIVPHFFSNAYNVFLLRQYMMGIPLELDEAARVDGANPLRILWHVIIPASKPALVAVYLFHFLFAWNDFQAPLIYIGGNDKNQVIAVGLQRFSQIYSSQQNLMMAGGVLTMIVPLLVFFFAQRIFMQGVVITGVEK